MFRISQYLRTIYCPSDEPIDEDTRRERNLRAKVSCVATAVMALYNLVKLTSTILTGQTDVILDPVIKTVFFGGLAAQQWRIVRKTKDLGPSKALEV